jgi:hypothetical protein
VGEFVPLVLEVFDLPLARRKVRRVGEGLLEEACGVDEGYSLLLKEVVEAPLAGDERQCPGIPSQPLSEATEPAEEGRSTFVLDQTPPFFALPVQLRLSSSLSRQKNAIVLPLTATPGCRKSSSNNSERTAGNCSSSADAHPIDDRW